ncbi:MAG: lactate racemase domain-containing protein [Deltaproteobacteria bacterium]
MPRADRFEPPAALPPLADLDRAVRAALAAPLGAPRLRELARGARSVVVTVPDASRPCPSEPVLLALLDELAAGGVPDDAVAVAIGCGLHATTGETERARLAGPQVVRRVEVVDAQGVETETVVLGETSLGAPVTIARRVAEADLVITVGVVEPHLYAGFSGGVKGVAIGCAGRETIAWTHHPAFISRPGVRVARLRENPFQATLREIAARTPLGWGVNLVVEEGDAAAVRAGDPASAQEALARDAAPGWMRAAGRRYDVVVAGVHAPKSDGLYQASRAATYLGLAARPAVADGGLIVLCADLPLGAGDGPGERNFLEVLAAAASPAEVLERGLRELLGPGGQRSYVVARVLARHRLAVVGAADAGFLQPLAHLGVTAFASVDAALAAADERLGRSASVLAVADAMTTLVTAA